MEEGFLRLSRRFFSNEMWKVAREFSECEAWLDLIQSARFDATGEAYSELIGGREISYSRGQYPASISFLMKRWKWSEKKVRYFLSKLKKKGMITTCNQQGMTVITLCNYDDYNPIKDNPKDKDKGIDNNKEISDLKVSMGELRAELRAMSQKMAEKIEDLGQGKGNKKKKDKETQKMRQNVQVGDEITTIGGIIGLVVSLKEDNVVIETAGERNKIRIKRWAIQSNATIHDDLEG